MKAMLLALAGLVSALGIFVAGNCGVAVISGKAYIDEALPAIAGSWEPRELLDRASSDLKRDAPPEKIDALFKDLAARLGRLKEYKGSSGKVTAGLWLQQGSVATASYVADTVFERRAAKIEMNLVHRGGVWQITGFHVRLEPGQPK